MNRYPASPDRVTPEWLNENCQLGGRVTSVSSTTIGEGVGMLGLLGRLTLEYADGAGPASVIAKLASPHESVLDLVQTFGFYEREINFYKHATGDITNIPRSHFAEVDASGRGFALILEDLSHCRVPDQVAGCSATDATTVMVELAKLHANHWHIDQNPTVAWLSKGNEGKYRDGEAQYAMVYEPFISAYGERLSAHGRRVADVLPNADAADGRHGHDNSSVDAHPLGSAARQRVVQRRRHPWRFACVLHRLAALCARCRSVRRGVLHRLVEWTMGLDAQTPLG